MGCTQPTIRNYTTIDFFDFAMIVRLRKDLTADLRPIGLSSDREYLVIAISGDDYRLMNDDDDPVIYEPELFDIVDAKEPDDWESELGGTGKRYARPRSVDRYAWEDYHDGEPVAVAAVKAYLATLGKLSWPASDR
jgi:hypothetical protein